VGGKVINNVPIKYRYLIPTLDDMLDDLHGFSIFFNINLGSGYQNTSMTCLMNFIVALLRTQRGHHAIVVVVE